MEPQAQDFDTLKRRLETTWRAGDYGVIARGLQCSAEAFLSDQRVARGERLLDVACGTGQIAIPAARAGANVTGLDLAEEWVAQAQARAADGGLDIRFDVGDAEAMPYGDGAFDVVMSLIGVMFAPRPECATAELLRVCRPGGRIILGNWTAEGFVGSFFRTVGQHAPPPEMPSPLLWGDECTVRERFGDAVSDLQLCRRMLHFEYPMPPSELADHYLEHFGPTRQAAAAPDSDGRKALRADLERLWSEANTAAGQMTEVDAEILEIIAVRA